ncbi:MAG TPA: methanol/ethanol family PQQ-dependent dehydrogenase [Polyangia bacterium]|nr:methanol/ethanol family PQQ-dependent dehydrogenase [Polyangia bacterium]
MAVLTATLSTACTRGAVSPQTQPSGHQFQSAGDPGAASRAADEGQWPMATHDYGNRRFSELKQIDTRNVARLQIAWTFDTGIPKGHEGAPLVVGDTMYVVTPFPNRLYALDLSKPGAPQKWKYEPPRDAAAQGVACCDVVNRGAAYADGRVFFNTLDNHTIAVDARTGRPIWNSRLGDIQLGETMTMAPMVVKGKVLVGNSGGEMGVRGWLTALDAATGKIAWRAYSAGPDADCLIGASFRPFYAQDRGRDLGVHTWPPERWKLGGGTVWGFLAYDPDADLVFYGTANPGSWNPELRPGDNKWSTGIFARRPETGEAIWYYQWSPHDLYDHDGVNENVLFDLTVDGQRRKVLAHADRNGLLYVLDRATGEVLSATPFVPVTTNRGVDMKTGRLIPVADKEPHMGTVIRGVCPSASGGKDWQPMAYSPVTGWLYIPHNNLCEDVEATEVNYIAGTPFVGTNVKMYAGPGGNRGAFTAWDPAAQKKVWSIPESFPAWSGALATAGGLVFYGTMDGWFKALDARTGQLLWKMKTGSGVIGQPISYLGPDGKQYVAVFAGVGGWAGTIVVADLDPRDESGANGFVAATKDLPKATGKGGTLYVFAVP